VKLTADRWNARWRADDTPWDLGGVTPALIDWRAGRRLAGLRTLVPGCGRGHDAHYLAKHGATVTAVDYAPEALAAAQRSYPHSAVEWVGADALNLPYRARFDRVWEYTCFCALPPERRADYFDNVRDALAPGGEYWGLVFLRVPRPDDGPPFQIEPDAFQELLRSQFDIVEFEPATPRSIKPRRGAEIWFVARKPA